jgi:hypothetical protein
MNPRQPTTNFGIVPMATATQIDGLTFLRNNDRTALSLAFGEPLLGAGLTVETAVGHPGCLGQPINLRRRCPTPA